MSDPPRDEDGYVVPHDDKVEIPDDALLVRYIHKLQLTVQKDERVRPSKGGFSESSKQCDKYEGMSVDMLDRLMLDKVDPCMRMPPGHEGAVLIRAGDLRALGLKVGPDPMRSNDPYHAGVWGMKRSLRGKVLKLCVDWYIRPANVVPADPPFDA